MGSCQRGLAPVVTSTRAIQSIGHRTRGGRIALAVLVGLAASAPARIAAADRDDTDAARVDWAAGRVTAGGTGVADRHAPSPAVALGTSRRGADEAARRRIAAKLGSLPLAGGGTLAARLTDPAIRARVDAAVAAAITIAADPETDGSWHVTLAVPLGEPRELPIAGDFGPPVIIVEGVTARPAIGWKVGGIAAPTLWVKEVPAWAKDALRVRATSAKAGAITVDAPISTAATLYLLVGKP
jgi:hypothetical protein